MAASIADVAKRANVSISTVSRVVNRKHLVSESTRVRVEEAIQELGYYPNGFARGLMLRKSEIVGLVLPDLHGEFYSEIIRGANMQARELGYHLVISSAKDTNDAQFLLSGIHQRTIMDGVAVMVSEVTGRISELLSDFRLPFVVMDGEVEGRVHDSVVIDQRAGALALMHHLVRAVGAKRVIFVGGLETNVDTIARLDAYRSALKEAALPFRAGDVYHLDYNYETAFSLAQDHIREWAGSNNCVFAANDEMAAGILDAAVAAGLSIPADLGIVGFDDTRIARMTRPQLTTVRVPMSRMGATAIELLCQRLADPEQPARRIALQPELVVRQSCGASARATA